MLTPDFEQFQHGGLRISKVGTTHSLLGVEDMVMGL
jgi:hypothetical protein